MVGVGRVVPGADWSLAGRHLQGEDGKQNDWGGVENSKLFDPETGWCEPRCQNTSETLTPEQAVTVIASM